MAVSDEIKGQQALWATLSPAEQKDIRERLLRGQKGQKEVTPKAKAAGNFELVGYVRCELGKSDREPFRKWQEGQTDVALFDMLVKLCDSGYLLKVGVGKEGHQASLSACDASGDCNGYVLSAFAGEGRDAIALLLYKHHILLEGDWTTSLGGTGKSGLR
jgi:hypothetical protein